jgi:FecR-like protein/putative zinc finger protein
MRRRDEMLLRNAVQALQSDAPATSQVAASARLVASRLGLDGAVQSVDNLEMETIENCVDVQHLLASYRAGTLSNTRSLLIDAHLRECGSCLRRYRSGSGAPALDWSTPKATRTIVWPPRAFGWVLASSFALLVCSFFVYRAYWQIPPGVRAEVESIDGSAYRISDKGDHQLSPGDKLAEGEHLRTNGGAHAVLRLSDGSTVEVNERSVLAVGARGRNMTISLDNGAVIVQAAKRDAGHLYVKTPDCRVAVTGTVFSVNSGIKGSRVAVLQGTAQMMHDGAETLMHAGDQAATYDNPSPAAGDEEISQQISWSHDRDKYLAVLAQLAIIQHRLEAIPSPQLRYTSDLLQRVPADTLLYISIPNLGEYLSDANKVFQDQLKQSPALQEWWARGHAGNASDPTADLDTLVEKLHQMSQYLGDEVVVVGVRQTVNPGFAIIADVQKSGLDDFLRTQSPFSASTPELVVFDEKSLDAAPASSKAQRGGYALVRQHEAVFSNSIATLKQINAQLNAGSSGFTTGAFGQQIEAAYGRGAGIILAADLHQMIVNQPNMLHAGHAGNAAIENSGMDSVQYLIAEHRETNGAPENHLNLQFSGTRQHVASWLAAPAPIGSLDFVTPNAGFVVALLSKDPKTIADDIIAMAVPDEAQQKRFNETESTLQISFRDDLAANLGGDFLLSLDGPVLPTPSWKAVIEVNDSARLEATLERLVQSIDTQIQSKGPHTLAIEPTEVGGQRFYALRDQTLGSIVAQYTFADGYLLVAPDRALLIEALRTHESGQSLAHSDAFKAALPKDGNENYSAIAYQNLSPIMTPLLSQVSGETAVAIRQLAADAKPTAIGAWGRDSRIEVASDSHLFGFDFLTLGTLIHFGNKHAGVSVRE